MHLLIPVEASDTESAVFAVGSLIADRYVVERTLGYGGLGVVVVARHRELGQRVAIKYLREPGRAVSSVVERFRREAHIAAQVRSEHVVRVQDVGEAEGVPFIVMEYLDGQDLGRVIAEGGITTAQAVDYALQACEGLAEIHAIGITHRDLKPENLFLVQGRTPRPVLKIIDFGISKVTPPPGDGGWAHVTCEDERFGTPLYMSPEQLGFGGGVDSRTDIWALGVVLFELLTGSFPFQGDDVQHLFASILMKAPVRPSEIVPGIAPALEAAILRCFEKDAQQRFANVAELAQQLAPFGSPDAQDRVRRIKTTLALAGVKVWSLTPPAPPTVPPELAPRALPARVQPTIKIPRAWSARRRARVLAPIAAALVALSAVLLLSQREERAGAAVAPATAIARTAAPTVTAVAPAVVTATAPAIPTAPAGTLSSSGIAAAAPTEPVRATAVAVPFAAGGRSSSRVPRGMVKPAPKPQPIADRRLLYGDRK